MFWVEAKVSSCKIGVPCSEMRGLIICGGIGADEKDTLDKKNNEKNQSPVRVAAALSCEVFMRFNDRLVYSRD